MVTFIIFLIKYIFQALLTRRFQPPIIPRSIGLLGENILTCKKKICKNYPFFECKSDIKIFFVSYLLKEV